MALMSIAKDAERIGDYCKNVFEVGQFYKEDFHVPQYHEPLAEIRESAEALFVTVREAFAESSVKKADLATESAGKIRTKCDMITEQLLLDASSISTHEAVAYSLLARHYKRRRGPPREYRFRGPGQARRPRFQLNTAIRARTPDPTWISTPISSNSSLMSP